MPSESTKNKTGFGCMMLFLLPFVVMGLGALIKGIRTYIENPVFTEDVIALLGVGGAFTLVGGFFMAGIMWSKGKVSEATKLKKQHPDSPWLWQKDWAEGRILSATPMLIFVFWLFGLTFGGAGALILFKLDEITKGGPIAYLTLLFPLVGLGMLCAAVYATLRWLKYGRVYCDLVTKPGVIGGWCQAILWAKISMAPDETVEAQLTCYHTYTTGSGDNSSPHHDIKWQEDMTITQDRMMTERDGTLAIPIKVYIPRDCTPTTPDAPSDRIEWKLSAKAEVAGIDFAADFIVPVFITEDSAETPPADTDAHEIGTRPAEPYSPTILVTEGMDSVELYAPPRRSISMLISITIFSIIWTAIVAGMIFGGSDIPLLFPIVFGFFNIIILWMALWMWFGKSLVRIEHGTVSIRKTILGIGSRKTIETNTITDVDMHINMQSGTVPYYTVRLHTPSGTKNTVGGIRNKDEAEYLVKRIEQAVSL